MADADVTKTPVLPGDFQEQVFKVIAAQRPAAIAYIKEIRRKKPDATPAQVMKTIESQYVATATTASAAIGASATIPAVGVPIAIGLGVADLLFFYESTALFAICMAELRGYRIDDPDRAKAVVLGAVLGEKRKSRVTELALSALPAGATIQGARTATEKTAGKVAPKWGDLLSTQLPDSALVPVTMVLAREAGAHIAVLGSVKISSKALPVIGAVAGGAASYYFGSGVVKSCREGFSAPLETWPDWLELDDSDGDGIPDPSRAVVAMRAATETAKDFGETVWTKMAEATEAFRSVEVDEDGNPMEARAKTVAKDAAKKAGYAAKTAGSATADAAKKAGSKAKELADAAAKKVKREG
ncbi:hypothetical protein [Demequina sp.]|uniref:hypothetical protein n=1 Tax=Demequina sp. TaxID=2050685 RepID=UPI003D140C42